VLIDELLCLDEPKETLFMKEVESYGMYAALIFAVKRKNECNGNGTVYGSSKHPHHHHHNRGSCDRFPVAG
jgi:hypothetical protein